jgi:hypothetical protein
MDDALQVPMIAEGWEDFLHATMPATASEGQINAMRGAFTAGAIYIFDRLMASVIDDNGALIPGGAAKLADAMRQFDEHVAAVRLNLTPPKGSA